MKVNRSEYEVKPADEFSPITSDYRVKITPYPKPIPPDFDKPGPPPPPRLDRAALEIILQKLNEYYAETIKLQIEMEDAVKYTDKNIIIDCGNSVV